MAGTGWMADEAGWLDGAGQPAATEAMKRKKTYNKDGNLNK